MMVMLNIFRIKLIFHTSSGRHDAYFSMVHCSTGVYFLARSHLFNHSSITEWNYSREITYTPVYLSNHVVFENHIWNILQGVFIDRRVHIFVFVPKWESIKDQRHPMTPSIYPGALKDHVGTFKNRYMYTTTFHEIPIIYTCIFFLKTYIFENKYKLANVLHYLWISKIENLYFLFNYLCIMFLYVRLLWIFT